MGYVEYQREQLRRISYSNLHFKSYKKGIFTDRGRIYIKYGEPDDITESDNTITWLYHKYNKKFVFNYDSTYGGDYKLVNLTDEDLYFPILKN